MPRIKIEDKHTYSSKVMELGGRMLDPNATEGGNPANWTLFAANVPTFPAPGTDENNRIGRKVNTSSISWETFIQMYTNYGSTTNYVNTIAKWYSNWTNLLLEDTEALTFQDVANNVKLAPLTVSVREMLVEFDVEFFQITTGLVDGGVIQVESEAFYTLMRTWFNTLFIQTGVANFPSNRSYIKRESTAYTGQFNILYDKVHFISQDKPFIHIKKTIPYKRSLNFNSGSAATLPTDKVIVHFFVGPSNVLVDYGNLNFGNYLITEYSGNNNRKLQLGLVYETLKMKYVDI